MFLEWSHSLEPTWIWGQSWNRLMCGSSSGLRIARPNISGWSNTPNEGHFLECQWYLNVSVANGTGALLMFPWPNDTQYCCQTWRIWSYAFLLVKFRSCTSRLIPTAISPCEDIGMLDRADVSKPLLCTFIFSLSAVKRDGVPMNLRFRKLLGSWFPYTMGIPEDINTYSEKCLTNSLDLQFHMEIQSCSHINPLVLSHEPTAG